MEGSPGLIDPVLPRVGILVARGTFYLIGVVLLVALVWLSLTRVNVVVRAEGHLAPRAEPVRLSVPQGGIIAKVLVDVGNQVDTGQPLLELDSFREAAEANQDGHELEQARAEAEKYSENARMLEAATNNIKQELASEQQVVALVSRQAHELREGFEGGAVSLFEVQVKDRDIAETRARIAQLSSELNRSRADARQNRWMEAQTRQKIKGLEIKLAEKQNLRCLTGRIGLKKHSGVESGIRWNGIFRFGAH